MDDRDRTAKKLDVVYILTFFVQVAASLAALVGLAGWTQARTTGWGLWILIGATICIVACKTARSYIKRWFRRRWPIGKG
jgi:hypothetical protein